MTLRWFNSPCAHLTQLLDDVASVNVQIQIV